MELIWNGIFSAYTLKSILRIFWPDGTTFFFNGAGYDKNIKIGIGF